MVSADEIQNGIVGAWRMMQGKADGLQQLDLTADGFWTSFYAILVALPPLLLFWLGSANALLALPDIDASRLGLVLRLALVDLAAWIVPLIALALVIRRAGIADRFVAYVVSTNWGSTIVAWLMLPVGLFRLMAPDATNLADVASLLMFILTLALTWRLTNVAIGKGPALATGVFVGTLFVSIFSVFFFSWLLGVGAGR